MKQQFLIAITLLTAIIGHAANEVIVDGVTYEWSASELGYVVTGWDEETPVQSLHIRGTVNDLDVVGIASNAFEDNEDIVFLTIDEGITYIGENAFCRCINLEVALMPEGLVTIEEEAFAFCEKLTTVVIPSTVEDIQSHAFMGCTGVTDVYFLMETAEQLDGFDWWDGVYTSLGEDVHGGMEFNTNENTVVHVPAGTYDIYDDSGKLEAWLFQEDSGSYPLWWIVNYGVVGREYTVSDDLTAVYADVDGGLYAKDDNHWLTPDQVYSGEVNYLRTTGLMDEKANTYDQSNWVVLRNVDDTEGYLGHLINGPSITGVLVDKKNPVIEVADEATLEKGGQATYVTNVYIPASFMGRTQLGADEKTYAFVRPKPQEVMRVDWTIYNDDDGGFYLPESDDEMNVNGLAGGFMPSYSLYEEPPVPELEDGGYYAFEAVNRLTVAEEYLPAPRPKKEQGTYQPYVDGGVSADFTVYPLSVLDEPVITGITPVVGDYTQANKGWYTIDGRLHLTKPTAPGIYIKEGKKVLIIP